MKPFYYFETDEFGLNDLGLHLLRSGFVYKTIEFRNIQSVRIVRGKELHNWFLILVIGLIVTALGVYMSIGFINMLLNNSVTGQGYRLVLLLLIPVTGVYFMYTAIGTGLVMRIRCADNRYYMFPLQKIAKLKKIAPFTAFLTDKLGGQVIRVSR